MRRFIFSLLFACLPVLFLVAMVFLPLFAMLRLDNTALLWQEVLRDTFYQNRLIWTIFQAACTVLITLILGVPIAWVLARLAFLGRQTILRFLMLPFVMPTLVVGVGVLALFGERGVLWRGWADTAALLLYGNVFFNLPVMILAAHQGFLAVPATRLAMAQTQGANAWQRFIYVELPVLKTGLMAASCLIFLYCFSGFGLALLLGGQRFATIEVEIYQLIAYELDMSRAGVLVWLVLWVTALAGGVSAWLGRQKQSSEIRFRQPEKPKTIFEKLLLWLVLGILFFVCVLPLMAVVVRAVMAGSAWRVWLDKETWQAVYNTVRFSAGAMCLATILGWLHAAVARRFLLMRMLTFLPFMVSPVCLSFGVLLCYPEWSGDWRLLIAVYALIAYPFVTKDILLSWDRLPENYFKAASVLGATPFQAACQVIFPLLRSAFQRGLTLAAATCVGEFAASLFLSRPEWTTLTTLIYRYLGKVGAENYDKAMVLTLLLMSVSCGAFWLLDKKDKA